MAKRKRSAGGAQPAANPPPGGESPQRLRVVVAGAMAWSDAEPIRRELSALPADAIIIHGDAPGCDALAGAVADALGLTVVPLAKSRADADRHPGAAWKGLNERMLAGADLVLVFHPAVHASRGSLHLLELARAAAVPARVIA